MKDNLSRLALLILVTAFGGWLLYWLGHSPPSNTAGWIGAGIAFFVWMMFLLSAFGRPLTRFLRILLGWS
ncbi:MAG: hypothetical protein P8Y10_04220 [Gemmatimonadales bacterium]